MTATATEGWRICSTCPPDDNEWPTSCFTHSSGSVRFAICNDCWTARYVRVRKPCDRCGYMAGTWRVRDRADEPVRHRNCEPGKKRERYVSTALKCVVCSTPHYRNRDREPPKRGFVVCQKCLPKIPPEYEDGLVQNERNMRDRILAERARRAA